MPVASSCYHCHLLIYCNRYLMVDIVCSFCCWLLQSRKNTEDKLDGNLTDERKKRENASWNE